MIGFMLEDSFTDCPKHWQNFVTHLQQVHNLHFYDVPDKILNKHLKKYNAEIVTYPTRTEAVVFYEDKYYAWFKLEWS